MQGKLPTKTTITRRPKGGRYIRHWVNLTDQETTQLMYLARGLGFKVCEDKQPSPSQIISKLIKVATQQAV